jgi:hypothetical protein
MRPELQRYLDGEMPRDALPPELAREAEEWDALLAAAATLPAERAPAWTEARVMARLPVAHPARAWHRFLAWLVEPRPVRLRPITLVAATAAAALVVAVPLARRGPGAPLEGAPPQIIVQFSVAAPGATSVGLAGDFNGWDPSHALLRDPDGDEVWTGQFALPPGVHKYMFVLDGERWITDPRAERYVDDGFGARNALIAVAAPVRRAS